MKVIFSHELKIYTGQDVDSGIFFGAIQMKHKDDSLNKISKFPKLFMICGCIVFKRPEEVAVITTMRTLKS